MQTAPRATIVADTAPPPATLAPAQPAPLRFYRHRLPVRVMHWINVACMTILLMSGLNIFNAHPALYWGHESTFADPWISIRGLSRLCCGAAAAHERRPRTPRRCRLRTESSTRASAWP